MRQGIRKDIDWQMIGAILANESDIEQTQFFKAFIKECLSWGTHLQVEQQLACTNLNLTKDERSVIGMLGFDE